MLSGHTNGRHALAGNGRDLPSWPNWKVDIHPAVESRNGGVVMFLGLRSRTSAILMGRLRSRQKKQPTRWVSQIRQRGFFRKTRSPYLERRQSVLSPGSEGQWRQARILRTGFVVIISTLDIFFTPCDVLGIFSNRLPVVRFTKPFTCPRSKICGSSIRRSLRKGSWHRCAMNVFSRQIRLLPRPRLERQQSVRSSGVCLGSHSTMRFLSKSAFPKPRRPPAGVGGG